MRVLIISALFACAAAAPSGAFAPLFYQSVAVPTIVPTVSPGDIQAAAIDAQVKIDDRARAAADQAQIIADQQQNLADQQQNLADQQQNQADQQQNQVDQQQNQADQQQSIVDQTVESVQTKSAPDADLVNEKNVEGFWSNEDKIWQAVDAWKTAEAQIDGAVASNAGVYAKSAVGGVIPYVATAPVAHVVGAPIPAISPVVYSPYLAALKSVSTEVKSEENKEKKQEAVVKTAEPEKEAVVGSAEKTSAAEKPALTTVGLVSSVVTPYSSVYRYNVPLSPVTNVYGQPIFNYASIQPVNIPYLRTVG